MKKLFLLAVVISVVVVGTSFADDAFIVGDFDTLGSGSAQGFTHEDAAPFKGFANVTVTNTGTQPWGDFHFEFYDPIGGQDISSLAFRDAALGGVDPTSSQDPLTWIIDNEAVGAKMDLFYYSDPILPGETATFSVYTDNTALQLPWFGLMIYPTPVPEPATLSLIALGGLLIRKRR